MKKLISMLLALTLVLALVPTVFAEDATFTYTFGVVGTPDTLTHTTSAGAWNYDASTGILKRWTNYGNGATYNIAVPDHNNGYLTTVNFPTKIIDTEYVISFDYMREFDATLRVNPRYETDLRYTFGPGLYITNNGDVHAYGGSGDIVIGNVGAYEWHNIKMRYRISSTENMKYEFYLDGKYYGPYYHNTSYTKTPATQLALYAGSVTSPEGAAISATRSDSRPESNYFKNFVVTNDLSAAIPADEVLFSSIKAVSRNEIVFKSANAIDTPVVDDVAIDGLTVSAVETVDANSFKVTVDETIGVNAEYGYDIYIGDANPVGTFVAKLPETLENFDAGTYGIIENAGWSHQQASRDGKEAYTGDKSFGFSPYQRNGVGAGYAGINKDSGQMVILTPSANYLNEKLVISADFARGSERVGFWPFALIVGQYRDPAFYCELTPAGEFKVGGTTYATGIDPLEWHNITLQLVVSSYNTVIDVYFDGELKVDNLKTGRTDGFHIIKTIGAFETLTDDALLSKNNVDPERNDIIMIDNLYFGRDFNYKTSAMQASLAGDTATIYSGAIDRSDKGVGVLASYDATSGAVKNVKLVNLPDALSGTTETISAETGDTVKFMAVDTLLNLKPIVDVVTSTK